MPLPSFLRFSPIYKDYLWGGDRIARRSGRANTPACTAESWEISAHPDGDVAVASGPLAGRTLSSLTSEFGRELLGTIAPSASRFPLLAKIIDARQPLSVQIHPSPADPTADPVEYKNECWHLLDADDGCIIYAGLAAATISGCGAVAPRISSASVAQALIQHRPRPGETLYIPAGLVHAIGAGALIYEIQQSSNTTYRFYDWDRVGPDGKPRPLHVEQALRSIDFSLPPPAFVAPRPLPEGGALCLATPYFAIREFRSATARRPGGESFDIVFAKDGAFRLSSPSGETAMAKAGDSVLVPASCAEYRIEPLESASAALVTSLR